MTDQLIEAEAIEDIARRTEAYLHLARQQVVNVFGPEASHDHVQVIATVAAMMANLEGAEMICRSQDRLVNALSEID
jgi:hypothetical protein